MNLYQSKCLTQQCSSISSPKVSSSKHKYSIFASNQMSGEQLQQKEQMKLNFSLNSTGIGSYQNSNQINPYSQNRTINNTNTFSEFIPTKNQVILSTYLEDQLRQQQKISLKKQQLSKTQQNISSSLIENPFVQNRKKSDLVQGSLLNQKPFYEKKRKTVPKVHQNLSYGGDQQLCNQKVKRENIKSHLNDNKVNTLNNQQEIDLKDLKKRADLMRYSFDGSYLATEHLKKQNIQRKSRNNSCIQRMEKSVNESDIKNVRQGKKQDNLNIPTSHQRYLKSDQSFSPLSFKIEEQFDTNQFISNSIPNQVKRIKIKREQSLDPNPKTKKSNVSKRNSSDFHSLLNQLFKESGRKSTSLQTSSPSTSHKYSKPVYNLLTRYSSIFEDNSLKSKVNHKTRNNVQQSISTLQESSPYMRTESGNTYTLSDSISPLSSSLQPSKLRKKNNSPSLRISICQTTATLKTDIDQEMGTCSISQDQVKNIPNSIKKSMKNKKELDNNINSFQQYLHDIEMIDEFLVNIKYPFYSNSFKPQLVKASSSSNVKLTPQKRSLLEFNSWKQILIETLTQAISIGINERLKHLEYNRTNVNRRLLRMIKHLAKYQFNPKYFRLLKDLSKILKSSQ